MSKILAVFGATGQQGSSVIKFVLSDPELSQTYQIRAITRDINSEKAKNLSEKVEVVQGDAHDRASLETALTSVHTVFIMTVSDFSNVIEDEQYNAAKLISDVALEKKASYIIFSTLPPIKEISGGKYTTATPFFDAKTRAESYIRGLPIKSAFVSLGNFFENFHAQQFLAPHKDANGNWIMTRNNSPETEYPCLSGAESTGNFVGAILADPDKYEGKTFAAAERLYTLAELTEIISKKTGKKISYRQISDEEFAEGIPFLKELFTEGFKYVEEFGYYGPGMKEQVAWAASNARGKLASFEEWVDTHPFNLE